jgi:hypothetical protein
MMDTKSKNLYSRVVDITTVYLGPAADRFIARQIRNHLKKSPEALSADDLKELVAWLQIAMAFLTNDQELLGQYKHDLKALTDRKTNGRPARDGALSRAS